MVSNTASPFQILFYEANIKYQYYANIEHGNSSSNILIRTQRQLITNS